MVVHASHSPSLAIMRRAPRMGLIGTVVTCGSEITARPTSASPSARLRQSPPGHTRRGPTPFPSPSSRRATTPPAAITRLRSVSESSSRKSYVSSATLRPSSITARESPTFPTVRSHLSSTATVAVVPDFLHRLMMSLSVLRNAYLTACVMLTPPPVPCWLECSMPSTRNSWSTPAACTAASVPLCPSSTPKNPNERASLYSSVMVGQTDFGSATM
mmetsp:Transcript_5441/g.18407  ORF Transcript_5441/g.18407 Transcript_5441/m.18407 type:complete len:216 (-) Transcript_5441:376-1023(-)